MAGEVNVESLNGLFKDQFHSDIENLIPDHCLLQKGKESGGLLSWVPSDKMNGEFYSVPTILRSNQGVTYLGESGAGTTLKDPKPGVMKEAQIKGSEINIRGRLTYKALSQAASAGPRAFKKSSAWLVEDLAQVAHTRVEIAMLYGQSGLGDISSVAVVTAGEVYDVVFTDVSFAPGMWILLEGATVEVWTSAGAKRASPVATVLAVTTASKTVRLKFAAAVGVGNDPAATDSIFFEGARTGASAFNEMVGLKKQLTDTTSTTLFNLDRSAYSLLKPNIEDGKVTNKANVIAASMKAVDKGAMKQLVALVGTKQWAALHAEDLALRRFDSSYSSAKSKSGSKEIEYETMAGGIRVVCHPLVKGGDIFIFDPDDVIIVGSSKPTFEIPGFGGEFFKLVQDTNSVELQNYADLAIYCLKPAQTAMLTNLTYA